MACALSCTMRWAPTRAATRATKGPMGKEKAWGGTRGGGGCRVGSCVGPRTVTEEAVKAPEGAISSMKRCTAAGGSGLLSVMGLPGSFCCGMHSSCSR